MNSSLQKLVKNLSYNNFKYLTQEFDYKNLELFLEKDAYPYEYMNSFKRFSEEKFPDKNFFYSSVKDKTTGDNGKNLHGHISNEDYLPCNKIWNKFNMKSMGDYQDHYLKKDVFEKFIDTCSMFCKLDLCRYFTSRGLSWNTMLKMTGVRLENISSIDIYLFLEK